MIVYTLSTRYAKALQSASSTATAYSRSVVPTATEPAGSGSDITDGVLNAGLAGQESPNRVFVMPYAAGGPTRSFSMRLWAWDHVGTDPRFLVWIPSLLAEFSCTLGAQNGIPNGLISDSEYFCDTLALTAGSLGFAGDLVSPGNGLIAYALVELKGCRKFQFDFQAPDSNGDIAMNVLWAHA